MSILDNVVFCHLVLVVSAVATEPLKGAYQPNWESLDRHQTPEWLQDAKLGVFIYAPQPRVEAWNAWRQQHGLPPKTINTSYNLDNVDWNVDRVLQEVVDAGARYVVLAGDERSYFLTWLSRYANIEGSKFTTLGPEGRDWLGEFSAKARQLGLRFGIYRNYMHPERNPYFLPTMYEMIDRYQPDTLWLDEHAHVYSADDLQSRELAAYYYNHSKKQDEVALEDSPGKYKNHRDAWGNRLLHGDWFRKEISPPHDEISEGYFVRYEPLYRYRSRTPRGREYSSGITNNMIEWLVDSVSKNGSLEVATHPGPARVAALQKRTLLQIGLWLEVNGEAIYATRPWRKGSPQTVTSEGHHVRFTTRDGSLYAILFDWPWPQATFARLKAEPRTRVEMLGVFGTVDGQQTDKGLVLRRPPESDHMGDETEIPCDHAFCFKISPGPNWISAK